MGAGIEAGLYYYSATSHTDPKKNLLDKDTAKDMIGGSLI